MPARPSDHTTLSRAIARRPVRQRALRSRAHPDRPLAAAPLETIGVGRRQGTTSWLPPKFVQAARVVWRLLLLDLCMTCGGKRYCFAAGRGLLRGMIAKALPVSVEVYILRL